MDVYCEEQLGENMCSAARVIVMEIGEIEALPRCFGFTAFHSPDELKQSAIAIILWPWSYEQRK